MVNKRFIYHQSTYAVFHIIFGNCGFTDHSNCSVFTQCLDKCWQKSPCKTLFGTRCIVCHKSMSFTMLIHLEWIYADPFQFGIWNGSAQITFSIYPTSSEMMDQVNWLCLCSTIESVKCWMYSFHS